MSSRLQKNLAGLVVLFSLMAAGLRANDSAHVTEPDKIEPLSNRLSGILAEKKVNERLKKLSEAGSQLALEEIPQSLGVGQELQATPGDGWSCGKPH